MTGTDPALDPRTLFLGAVISAGFASVTAVLAIALTGSWLLTLLAGGMPVSVLLLASLDYESTHREGVPGPNRDSETSQMQVTTTTETHDAQTNAASGGQ